MQGRETIPTSHQLSQLLMAVASQELDRIRRHDYSAQEIARGSWWSSESDLYFGTKMLKPLRKVWGNFDANRANCQYPTIILYFIDAL